MSPLQSEVRSSSSLQPSPLILPPLPEDKQSVPRPNRLFYIDNLRLYIIVIVVMIHFALMYGGGSYYYGEVKHVNLPTQLFFSFFHMFTQTYFMALLFLISGYFAQRSYTRKGVTRFITDRMVRLGIPTALFMFIIQPFILYYLLDVTWIRPKPSVFAYYGAYISHGTVLDGSGPLWFALALLIFSLVYAGVRRVMGEAREQPTLPLPTSVQIWVVILLITAASFLVRLVQPISTNVFNMQLCYFSQYIVYFAIGIMAARSRWFDKFPTRLGYRWLLGGLLAGAVSWVVLIVGGGALHGHIRWYNGGFYWQSVATAFWGTAVGTAVSIGLLVWFREKFNRQPPLVKFSSDNAFAVYVTHTPIIIAFAMAMKCIAFPPLPKFLVMTILGIPLCFLGAALVRRIPLLKEIL